MNFINKVTIKGFWGDKNINLDFNEDVNFLIGINGSGKTTVINLIVAALTADIRTLRKIDFETITITLRESNGRKKPEVSIRKKGLDLLPYEDVEYSIKYSASEKPTIYSLDDINKINYLNEIHPRSRHIEYNRLYSETISDHLEKIVKVSWLSVHRATPGDERDRERRTYASTVDRKLDELSNRLVRYFSILGRQGSELLEKFQETIFLSMLVSKKHHLRLFDISNEQILNLDTEKKSLNDIFSQFNLDEKKYSSRVDNHFNILKKATNKISSKEPLDIRDIATVVLNDRIDQIIDDWNILEEKREEIFKPRETFIEIINNLVQRKVFSINERNELKITTQSGKDLPLRLLSSGEKQLLIVLGEALLQENKPCVYIADEPELSLHINWQESLVDNLLALNPKAQIVFATHSPDVVSRFGNKVTNMESVF